MLHLTSVVSVHDHENCTSKLMEMNSTHLSRKTQEWMDWTLSDSLYRLRENFWKKQAAWPFSGGMLPGGWIVDIGMDHTMPADMPDDLAACLNFSRESGCSYILFRQDGPVHPALDRGETRMEVRGSHATICPVTLTETTAGPARSIEECHVRQTIADAGENEEMAAGYQLVVVMSGTGVKVRGIVQLIEHDVMRVDAVNVVPGATVAVLIAIGAIAYTYAVPLSVAGSLDANDDVDPRILAMSIPGFLNRA